MKYTCIKQHDITDGGAAKTKAQRQAAQTAAKKNVTKTNVKQTIRYVGPVVALMATATTPVGAAVGVIGYCCGEYL